MKGMCLYFYIVLSISLTHQLYLSHAFSKNYGPVSGRDFLDVSQTSALPDGSFVKAWHSLDASACTAQFPPVAGYVRGFQHLGGWHFAPNATRTGTTVTFIVHTDMRGCVNTAEWLVVHECMYGYDFIGRSPICIFQVAV